MEQYNILIIVETINEIFLGNKSIRQLKCFHFTHVPNFMLIQSLYQYFPPSDMIAVLSVYQYLIVSNIYCSNGQIRICVPCIVTNKRENKLNIVAKYLLRCCTKLQRIYDVLHKTQQKISLQSDPHMIVCLAAYAMTQTLFVVSQVSLKYFPR